MVMDGTRCEELVELFEVSQGRFPYPVAGLQGREAFGCDILSFATEEEREQFVESGGGRIHLVQRFIEVKGRSEPKGSVLLGGNQLSAARRYEAKYYLYRVYGHRGEDRWQVIELSDPLGYEWEVSYAVDLLRCPAAVCWEVAAASADGQNGAR
jgi:hypothetical protein